MLIQATDVPFASGSLCHHCSSTPNGSLSRVSATSLPLTSRRARDGHDRWRSSLRRRTGLRAGRLRLSGMGAGDAADGDAGTMAVSEEVHNAVQRRSGWTATNRSPRLCRQLPCLRHQLVRDYERRRPSWRRMDL